VILCVAVVGTALILIALNAWMKQPGSPLAVIDRYQVGYEQGYNDAREQLRTTGLLLPSEETRSFNGTIVSVGDGSLVVRQTSLDTNPRVDDVPDERTVIVTSSTKVVRQTDKDSVDLEKELKAYDAAVKTDPEIPMPDAVVSTDMKLSDIPVDARVTVYADEDVRLLEQVVATRVVVQGQPVAETGQEPVEEPVE